MGFLKMNFSAASGSWEACGKQKTQNKRREVATDGGEWRRMAKLKALIVNG